MNIQSQIRHFLTFLAGLGGILASNNLIGAEQVDAANQAGAALIEPTAVIVGAIAAGLTRALIGWIGKLFGKTSDDGKRGAGKALGLMLAMCTAAGLMALPSCTTVTAPDGTVTKAPDKEAIQEGASFARWIYGIFTADEDEGVIEESAEVEATK